MDRNESWDPTGVTALSLHLAWASLEVVADDGEDFRLSVSGDEFDVQDLRVGLENGRLTVEQPAYGLSYRIKTVRWMQAVLRLPRTWKGAVDAGTIAGQFRARGLSGTDLSLETVSGPLHAAGISGLEGSLRTVTGSILAEELSADRLSFRSVSGTVSAEAVNARAISLNTVSGDVRLVCVQPFEKIEGNSITGDVNIAAPLQTAKIQHRSVTGRLRTEDVSADDGGPVISLTSVSGSLSIDSTVSAMPDAPDA